MIINFHTRFLNFFDRTDFVIAITTNANTKYLTTTEVCKYDGFFLKKQRAEKYFILSCCNIHKILSKYNLLINNY